MGEELLVLCARWAETGEDWDERALFAHLPEEVRGRIARRRGIHRYQTLAAYGLLLHGARRFLGAEDLPELCYGPLGKPAFAAHPDLHFSLTHTAGLALCAFSDAPVGVDAEKIRPVTEKRAARLVLPQDPAAFYLGWTERESRIKCRGGSALQCRTAVELEAGEHYHALSALLPEHAAGVCAQTDAPPYLETVDLTILLQP